MGGNATNRYYCLFDKATIDMASACLQEKKKDQELIENVIRCNSLGVDFVLRKLTRGKDFLEEDSNLTGLKYLWRDLQSNAKAFILMSSKMQELVSNHLTGEEGIVWVPAKIIGPEDERTYYIPRFTRELDLLDKEKSIYSTKLFPWESERSVLIPWFSFKKIHRYAMFHSPFLLWELPTSVYISEEIKTAIRKAKLSGIAFEDVRVSYD